MDVWNDDENPGIAEEFTDWESALFGGMFIFIIVMAAVGFATCLKVGGQWLGWL